VKELIAVFDEVDRIFSLPSSRICRQISRYLDAIEAPLSTRKHGLLLVAFCRALRRYAAKSSRLKSGGTSSELSNYPADNAWLRHADARLDIEKVIGQLSEINATVLMLRAAEYEWKEIALLFGVSVASARNRFWREIQKIRCVCGRTGR
jgi:hypothetical protein